MLRDRYSCGWTATRTALKVFKSDIIEETKSGGLFEGNDVWYLPVINSMLKSFTEIAITYFQFLAQFDSDNDVIVTAFGDIMQIVRIMTADHTKRVNANGARRSGKGLTLSHGLFFTVNQIIRLCDTINNQTYLNHALQEVDKFRSIWTSFPLFRFLYFVVHRLCGDLHNVWCLLFGLLRSDVVTHLYYKGRFNLQRNNDLVKAREELSFAHRLCHRQSVNRYRIQLLLIPIEMMLGRLPNLSAFAPPIQERFRGIVCALREGNMLLFRRTMDRYQNDFIHCGIYLLLQKLDLLVSRSVLHKAFLVQNRMGESKPHIITLSTVQRAVEIRNAQYRTSRFYRKFGGGDNEEADYTVDMDEMECVLAALVFKKLVRGYVAHRNAIVLSTKMAFPPIKSVPNWWKSDF